MLILKTLAYIATISGVTCAMLYIAGKIPEKYKSNDLIFVVVWLVVCVVITGVFMREIL